MRGNCRYAQLNPLVTPPAHFTNHRSLATVRQQLCSSSLSIKGISLLPSKPRFLRSVSRERTREISVSSTFSSPPLKMLVQQYLFEGIFASLLGFVLLYGLRWKKKAGKRAADKAEIRSDGRISSGGGGCRSDGGGSAMDVIVVGAGVAGSALAYTLGKDGRRVHVIERDLTEPDRIVGELLQPGGYLKLVELGLQDCVEEIDAQRVLGYALFKDGKSSKVSYPLDKFQSDVAGRTFHNGRFIQRMREKAASLPNITLEQGNVTSLLEENGTIKGVKYKTKTGEELQAYAPLTVVCDGCFSNLRRSLCSPKVDVPSCFVGVVLENCQLPYPNHGHVILADPSPILFYPISSTEIRCLVDVPGQKVPSIANGEMANYLKTVVAPQIPEQLHDAFISAIDRGSMRTMPNKSMPASPYPTPGALLMGDAFNMRHPLTGGGMTVALSDIVVLHNLLKPLHDLHDASLLCKYLESFYTLRKPVASTINTLADALYKVFCASPDQAMKEMRQACFDYLSLGGIFSSGPVALLSGLNPRPLSLVGHFFAVAIFGVGRLFLRYPFPKSLLIGARLISVRLCFPIGPIGTDMTSYAKHLPPSIRWRGRVFLTPPIYSRCLVFNVTCTKWNVIFSPLLCSGKVHGFLPSQCMGSLLQGAANIIFPIIKAEGVRQMFFPATVPACYRAPPTP